MNLGRLVALVFLLFPVSEVLLAVGKRARRGAATLEDRGSIWVLWLTICTSVALAILCTGIHAARLPIPTMPRIGAALGLYFGGLALRWWAILTLGRFFTVDVAISSDHRLVESGPYRTIRHPSYTGLLLAFFGFGIFLGNGLSVLVLMVPIGVAVLHRIEVEEAALRKAFGATYAAYGARTKRVIPGVF